MTYAHVLPTMREADFCFRSFLDEWKNSIRKAEKYKVHLINGDEHHFVSFHNYRKWSIGRTYTLDGRLYHSGVPYVERREP